MYETVYMVWDIYDRARSGIANYKSEPCYFNCRLDPEGGYSEQFELAPISNELLELATKQWKIYRTWEMKYHTGKVKLETHPGNKGIDKKYDELDELIKDGKNKLHKYRCLFTGSFRALPDQDHLPDGVLREVEVEWQVYSPNNKIQADRKQRGRLI